MTIVKSSSRHAQQQRVARDAGVGDDDLDRAELRLDLGEGGVDRCGIGHVGADGEGSVRALAGAGGDGDAVALRHELLGDGEADAAVAAGDEYGAGRGHGVVQSGSAYKRGERANLTQFRASSPPLRRRRLKA